MNIHNYAPQAQASAPAPTQPAVCPADISRLIDYAPAELIGREAELKVLSEAWALAMRGEAKRPHVLTFVALGGEGKTSLVAKWAVELAHADWPGCDAVFAWSFYSQGTREQVAASSDLFLKEALTYFGDAALAGSAAGSFDKGRRLAQLVGARRCLLLLDGLEPLQYAPTSPTPGELKDQGLAALLKGLAASSRGLCVVTTRYSVPDLRAFWQSAAPEVKLARLSPAAGVRLLEVLGVSGTRLEKEKLVEDVRGHALTLGLIGTYLRDAHGGDLRRRDLVKLEEANEEEQGGHAFRVMDAYAQALAGEGDRGRRALALLSLLGLFDRPANAECLAVLLQAPAVTGLTEPLLGMTEAQRNLALTRLEDAKLLTVNREVAGALVSLDAHPLLREYFGQRLREEQPEAWRAAHRRLYEHLCATTKEGDQPTLEDLQPLYQAVAHGCLAGITEDARAKVFRNRIRRGREQYSHAKLGAFGSDLGAIACLFKQPWSELLPGISESGQAWLLNEAAFCLRALGRLNEALEPMRAGLPIELKREDWNNAAARASNLSELELTLGEVAGAVGDAEQAVTYADRSGDAFLRMALRTTHGDALHQAGRRAEAEARFREAEQMQADDQPEYPLLYSTSGFRYCDLLLAETERAAWQATLECGDSSPLFRGGDLSPGGGGRSRERIGAGEGAARRVAPSKSGDKSPHSKALRAVEQRAAQTLQWAQRAREASLLTIALDHLTLGRVALYAAMLERGSGVPPLPQDDLQRRDAAATLDAAVAGLRRAGDTTYLPRGLLTRAWLRWLTGAHTGPASAQADLDEAWEIAERGPMPLFLADIHLHRARLFGRRSGDAGAPSYPWQSPQHDLTEARRLILKHGYLRRMPELEDAEKAFGLA